VNCDWITLEWFVLTNSFRALGRVAILSRQHARGHGRARAVLNTCWWHEFMPAKLGQPKRCPAMDRNRPTMWLPNNQHRAHAGARPSSPDQLIGNLSQQSPELVEALFESGGYSGRDIFSNGPHSCQVRSTGRAPYDPYTQHTSYSPYSPYSPYPVTTAAPYVGPKGSAPFGGAGITYTGPLPT
jgi:hypothetical protein